MPATHTIAGIRLRARPDGTLIVPPLGGAEEPTEEEKAAAAKADAEAAEAKAAAEKAAADAEAAKGKGLTAEDRAALEAVVAKERKAAKDAEKAARDAQARLKEIEDAQLSETEKLKKEAEQGKELAQTATTKLRQANLRDALADKGYTGAKAKAVAKLLDSVEFGDDDEPSNLDDALKAASEEYGDLVKPSGKPNAPDINGGGNGGGGDEKPALTADELTAAKKFGMTPEEYQQYKDPQFRPERAAAA